MAMLMKLLEQNVKLHEQNQKLIQMLKNILKKK